MLNILALQTQAKSTKVPFSFYLFFSKKNFHHISFKISNLESGMRVEWVGYLLCTQLTRIQSPVLHMVLGAPPGSLSRSKT